MIAARKFPIFLITRPCPLARYEVTAAYDSGEAFKHFERAADVEPFMARHGYMRIAPRVWQRGECRYSLTPAGHAALAEAVQS